MKAATGELNLTVITVIAIGLIATLFYTVLWPRIRDNIDNHTNDVTNGAPTGMYEDDLDFEIVLG